MRTLIRREFRPGAAPLTNLPFVDDVKDASRTKRRNFWNVPQTDDYGAACDDGMQFACDLLQYLKDNPSQVGANVIGCLVPDMVSQRQRGAVMHGYEVGFWSALEVILHRAIARENHWDAIQGVLDHYARIEAARVAEEAAERAGRIE